MITNDELKKITSLAKLKFDKDELDILQGEMSDLINFCSKLKEIELEYDNCNCLSDSKIYNSVREDIIKESYENNAILSNCKTAKGGFFYIAQSVREK